jgi:hypothetical protein
MKAVGWHPTASSVVACQANATVFHTLPLYSPLVQYMWSQDLASARNPYYARGNHS